MPIHVYINRIDNRLVFKIKDGYKLDMQMPETTELCGNTKKLIDKTKWRKRTWSSRCLEVAEVLLVQCNLVDNQYQQKSEVLLTFTTNRSYSYLLNLEPSNLVFLNTLRLMKLS